MLPQHDLDFFDRLSINPYKDNFQKAFPAPKTRLDNLFPLAKIRHKFLAIRLGDYFGRNKFTSIKRNLVFLGTFKISHFFEPLKEE